MKGIKELRDRITLAKIYAKESKSAVEELEKALKDIKKIEENFDEIAKNMVIKLLMT